MSVVAGATTVKRPPVPPGSFQTIPLTPHAYHLLEGLESAAALVESANTPADMASAYRLLTLMRERVTTYVSALEAAAVRCGAEGIEQSLILRFQ